MVNVKAQTYLTNEFVKEQAEQRTRASKTFEEIVEKLQVIVDRVCNDVKERARASGEGLVGDDPNNLTLILRPHQLKSKSLVSIKEEQAARLRQLRKAAYEANMLGDFVRLVDVMTVENLVLLTLNTNVELFEVLQAPRKTGLFQTTVSYGGDAIAFNVTADDIIDIVYRMSEGMLQAVNSVPRLLYMNPFKSLVAQSMGTVSGLMVGRTVRDSVLFIETQEQIEARVGRDFQQARAISQVSDICHVAKAP